MKQLRTIFLASALLLATAEAAFAQTKNGFDLTGALVPAAQIESGGPSKDGIPAIDRPKFVGAGDARFLQGDDRVLGVARNGIAKAYPVRILNWHEIVNDTFGAEHIAVTFCPLCGTGIAYVSEAGASHSASECRGCSTTAMCWSTTDKRSHSGRRSWPRR